VANGSRVVAPRASEWPAASSRFRIGFGDGPLRGLHPLLFAAYPILFLWSQNLGEVRPDEVFDPLVRVVAVVAITTLLLGLVLRDRRRAALIVTPVVVGALFYVHIADFAPSADIENVAWVAVALVALVAALRLGRSRLATVDAGLLSLSAILVALPLASIVPYRVQVALTPPPPVIAGGRVLASHTDAVKRDVYFLVFDRYGSDRALQLRFGVTNPLTPWLRDHGFDVLADSHANYVSTAMSLATTLNMSHLETLTGMGGSSSSNYQPIYDRLQSSLTVRQFQALGYRYLHLGSWFNPTRTDKAADVNYNADGVNDFTSVMFEQTVGPTLVKALGLEEQVPSESTKHLKHNTYALNTLDQLPGQSGPKFVWAHILLPHPPYVFDSDGRYIPPEEQATLRENNAFQRQLTYTNTRIEAFLEKLLSLPEDQQPIIILQADEGPWTTAYAADKGGYDWTTATPDEVESKFGIMNAWYLPGGTDLGLSQSMTAINTFPTLFTRYFGLDYPQLPDRVSASRGWNLPYEQIDLTPELYSLH
jgi:hypothetical protein